MTSNIWHILGVGSIGGLFAHRLASGGATIKLLSRDSEVASRILKLGSAADATGHSGIHDTDSRFDCDWIGNTTAIEHLLITTKSWGAGDALTSIRHRLNSDTVVVAMMNGMQHVADIQAIAPQCQLFLATTTAGCHRTRDLWIPSGSGKTMIGPNQPQREPKWLKCWHRGVPDLSWHTDIHACLIGKVAINACINPLTAIYGVVNGDLLEPALIEKTEAIISEVAQVLEDLGYGQLASELPHRVREVIEDTASNTSSMLSDVQHGQRTEADTIVGWLLTQTERKLPRLSSIATRLKSLEPNPI